MTERDRLLYAVAAEPEDDTPRRIFADWLDDHDEPQRATFVRTGLDLAAMDRADPRYPATLAAHRRAWTPPTRPWEDHIPGARVAFQRGFLHRANFVELGDYLDTDPRDWQRVPLGELGLFSRGSTSAEQWATRRTDWSRLRLLTLRNDWACDDLAAVLSQPSLGGLKRLRLENVHAREEGCEIARQRLSEAIRLPRTGGASLDRLRSASHARTCPGFRPAPEARLHNLHPSRGASTGLGLVDPITPLGPS